ncbi:MAG: hypothetical protein AAGB34_04310 [Planctomycetota bacterium]
MNLNQRLDFHRKGMRQATELAEYHAERVAELLGVALTHEPVVKLGQGEYTTEIMPSDVLGNTVDVKA